MSCFEECLQPNSFDAYWFAGFLIRSNYSKNEKTFHPFIQDNGLSNARCSQNYPIRFPTATQCLGVRTHIFNQTDGRFIRHFSSPPRSDNCSLHTQDYRSELKRISVLMHLQKWIVCLVNQCCLVHIYIRYEFTDTLSHCTMYRWVKQTQLNKTHITSKSMCC